MRIGNRRGRGSIATRGSQFKILDALGDWATRNAGAHPQPIEDRIPLKMVARPYFDTMGKTREKESREEDEEILCSTTRRSGRLAANAAVAAAAATSKAAAATAAFRAEFPTLARALPDIVPKGRYKGYYSPEYVDMLSVSCHEMYTEF